MSKILPYAFFLAVIEYFSLTYEDSKRETRNGVSEGKKDGGVEGGRE